MDELKRLARRPRRLRRSAAVRALVEECRLEVADLIAPLFVREGEGDLEAVSSMPGVFRHSINDLVRECRELASLGLLGIALFPATDRSKKDPRGSEAL